MDDQVVVFDDAEGMAWLYLCSLKMALRLAEKGIKMTRKAPSPYTIARSYGYEGTRQQIYGQVLADVDEHRLPSTLVDALRKRRGEA